MKLQRPLVVALFAILFATPAVAQIGVYAGFSGSFLNSGGSTTLYGPLVGIYAQSDRFIAIGGDTRGSFVSRDGVQFYTGAFGLRVAIKPYAIPFKPYAEALFGVASFNSGNSSSNTYANYQLIGGVDTTILPHIDWRIIDFDYSAVFNNPINSKTLTTGLVIRLR